LAEYKRLAQEKAEKFKRAAELIEAQIDYGEGMWLKRVADQKFGRDVVRFVEDIQRLEKTGGRRLTTWAKGKSTKEAERVRNSLGYHVQSGIIQPQEPGTASSPEFAPEAEERVEAILVCSSSPPPVLSSP
jgi:hypothetical protein